jgi:hypothetical protein
MNMSTATIETPLAARYLTQLCKHFEHKLPVTHGDGAGSIAFSASVCTLAARENVLALTAEAPDDAALAQVQDVVARHLVRFSFREPLVVNWRSTD